MPQVRQRPIVRPHLPDRPGRWKLLLHRQRRLFGRAVAGVLVLCALAGGASTLRGMEHGQGLRERLGDFTAGLGLRVQDVIIEGRQKTPEPLLRAAIGAAPGDPILTYSVAGARQRIETINWVQGAIVERRLPGTIVVVLTERRPFAVWQHDGKFVLIDRGGDVVTDSDMGAFAGQLPLVVGAGAPAAAVPLLDALAAEPGLQPHVVAAVRVGERRWNLHLRNGGDVLLPEGAEPQAIAKLVQLQKTYALLDRPLQVVDMRLPDRLSIRPQIDVDKLPDAKDPDHGAAAPPRKPT
jgi:cell division protein FtsQ